jgi:hypothetical protein
MNNDALPPCHSELTILLWGATEYENGVRIW